MSPTQKRHPRVTPITAGNPSPGNNPIALRNREFARRLGELMERRRMSQSDLARAAFGTAPDKHGTVQVRGRDRISSYVRGMQFPDNENLTKIAVALDVDESMLIPDMKALAIECQEPDFNILPVPNSDTHVRVIMNVVVDMKLAAKLLVLLRAYRDEDTGRAISKETERDFDAQEADWNNPHHEEDLLNLREHIRN